MSPKVVILGNHACMDLWEARRAPLTPANLPPTTQASPGNPLRLSAAGGSLPGCRTHPQPSRWTCRPAGSRRTQGRWRPGRIWILLDPAGRLRSTQAAKGEPGRPASEPPAAATPKGLPGDARVAMGWFAGVRGSCGSRRDHEILNPLAPRCYSSSPLAPRC